MGMLDRIISFLPAKRQILLYSATFPVTVEEFMVGFCWLFVKMFGFFFIKMLFTEETH
jgi:superfamily II DNA/RNA helicase